MNTKPTTSTTRSGTTGLTGLAFRGFRFIAPLALAAMVAMPLTTLGGIATADDSKPATPPVATPPAATPPATNPATAPSRAPARDNAAGTAKREAPATPPTSPNGPVRQRPLPANNQAQGRPTDAKGTSAVAAPDPNAKPVLKFDPEVLDFGEMLGGVTMTKTVKITNISDQPVTITRAVPSCGCTVPVVPKDPIAPGATAEGQISLKPPEKQGTDLNKKVTFQIDGHPPMVYELKGHVVEVISVKPDFIDAPAPDQAESAATVVTLTSIDGNPFKVASVNPPIVKNLDTSAAAEHKLEIDWAAWAEQGKTAKLTVVTDHPKAPNLMVVIKRSIRDVQPIPPKNPVDRAQTADPLVSAVRSKNIESVKLLLAGGADPNKKDPVGGDRTPMHWAAKDGNKEIMELLIAAKGNLEIADRVGKTPLSVAAESKDGAAMVAFLLEKGASPNARDTIGGSPLLWAAGLGSPDSVKALVAKGADVNVVDVNGLTPILWAAGIGSPDTVEVLLKAGAKTDASDKITGDTALMRAARTGRVESLALLIKAGAALNARNLSGQTAFMLAATSGSVEKLQALKDAGADVKATDSRGWNAMDFAKNRIDNERGRVVGFLEGFLAANAPANTAPSTTPAGGATAASGSSNGTSGDTKPAASTEPAKQPTASR
ncbi:MAG: ankyrin repeat domain-containing protein [Phycisphaerae bacterium]|nr:ankyrin repeat domain-containing protein [Phycisphaerae bacterium]